MVCSVTKLTIVTPTFHVYHCLCLCVFLFVCVCVCVCFVCGCGCGCFPPTPFPHPILPSPFSHPTPFSIPSPSPLLPCPHSPWAISALSYGSFGSFGSSNFKPKLKKPKPNIFAAVISFAATASRRGEQEEGGGGEGLERGEDGWQGRGCSRDGVDPSWGGSIQGGDVDPGFGACRARRARRVGARVAHILVESHAGSRHLGPCTRRHWPTRVDPLVPRRPSRTASPAHCLTGIARH